MFGIALLQLFAFTVLHSWTRLLRVIIYNGFCRQQCILLVLTYLLHWANGIPALAHVVFTYLLHWANRIPALAHLTYIHILCGYNVLGCAQAISSNVRCIHFHFHICRVATLGPSSQLWPDLTTDVYLHGFYHPLEVQIVLHTVSHVC